MTTFQQLATAPAATAEEFVRAFAQQYPTPNTLQALAYCETGRLGWQPVADLFGRSLATALVEVKA